MFKLTFFSFFGNISCRQIQCGNEIEKCQHYFFLKMDKFENFVINFGFWNQIVERFFKIFSFLSSIHVVIIVIVVIIIVVIVVVIVVVVDRHIASVCQTKKRQKDCCENEGKMYIY